jgi:hypothetical protein
LLETKWEECPVTEDKIVDAAIVEPESADGKKSVMFGWCMDGNDEECIGEFPGHRCRCECHSDLGSNVVEEN